MVNIYLSCFTTLSSLSINPFVFEVGTCDARRQVSLQTSYPLCNRPKYSKNHTKTMKDTGPHSVPLSKPFCFVGGFKVATKIAETSKMAEHQCQHVFLFFKYCFALLYLMWPGWTCKVSNCISSFRADGTAATVVYANILSERFRKVEATLVDGQRNQRF